MEEIKKQIEQWDLCWDNAPPDYTFEEKISYCEQTTGLNNTYINQMKNEMVKLNNIVASEGKPKSKERVYIERAILPAVISSGILVSIGLATKRNLGVTMMLGFLGLPIGYVIGNAGKW